MGQKYRIKSKVDFRKKIMLTTKKISPQGENMSKFFNLFQIIIHLWQYRDLIMQLTRQEVISRYKGSFIGLGWAVIHPLLMLSVYTYVFSILFAARWHQEPGDFNTPFVLILFIGLITFQLFSEVINAAPSLVLNHVNYVKKVVFPLEILIIIKCLGTLINALFSLSAFILVFLMLMQFLHWTILLLPIVWLPMIFFTLGCGYFVSSLGVFIRDLNSSVSILTTMLLFMTPVFYSNHAVPEKFRFFYQINPIAIFINISRRVVLWGLLPDWPIFFLGLICSILIFVLGFVFFMKSKKGFADVM